jgi:hypothetical protein
MITVDMTIREAINVMWLLSNDPETKTLRDRLIKAIEIAAGDANTTLTLHKFPDEYRVRVIQIIRANMGWGLKEANDWVNVVRGKSVQTLTGSQEFGKWGTFGQYETHYEGGVPNTLSASSKAINDMAIKLREMGAEVTTG